MQRKRGQTEPCYVIHPKEDKFHIYTTYYVGLDWLKKNKLAFQVHPKMDGETQQTDILKMLFQAMQIPEAAKELPFLSQIHWDEPWIPINHKQDILTPFLVVEFLQLVKAIVRKGLRKSYYKVEHNLRNRVKGKILVSKTIKHNVLKNRLLQTYCAYDEFGFNNKENRLLKKALLFVQRYLSNFSQGTPSSYLDQTLSYIRPAFEVVSGDISIQEVRSYHKNPFYKEYERALQLAKMILRRFGYNLQKTSEEEIKTPPFWIDMPILFELYALRIIKESYGSKVHYHFSTRGNELDFLLNDEKIKMVIDAKYIPAWNDGVNHENVRQVSGYARLNKVYKALGVDTNQLIDGLIIYPAKSIPSDQVVSEPDENKVQLKYESERMQAVNVKDYKRIFKIGIPLPTVNA